MKESHDYMCDAAGDFDDRPTESEVEQALGILDQLFNDLSDLEKNSEADWGDELGCVYEAIGKAQKLIEQRGHNKFS